MRINVTLQRQHNIPQNEITWQRQQEKNEKKKEKKEQWHLIVKVQLAQVAAQFQTSNNHQRSTLIIIKHKKT